MTCWAPSRSAIRAFSSLDTVAMTVAPRWRAHLNQKLAYTAGCRMNKDSLARTDDMDVMQEKTRGDAFEKPGSGHVVGYIFREMNQQIGLHVATLRIRADRRTSPADMMEIRQLLEPAAAAFAATNASATELNAVREAHQIACDAKDMPEFEHWDAEFHHRVFACCRNDFLKEIHNLMRAIRNQSLWFEMKKRSFSEERRQRYCEEHQAILDALLRRDPDGAKTAMTIHLRTVEKNLLGR